jgi:two-component system cell cycle response regulator
MRVLIAEDDPMSRLVLEAAVNDHGHEVLVAEDGAQAWDLFASTPDVDVVITDRVMPGLDGVELCRLIRRWEEGREGYTYVILVSVLKAKTDVHTGIEAGADDYLTKPLDRHELQMRLLSARRVTALHHRLAQQTRQMEAFNDELRRLARRDALTGLGNRLLLQEDLDVLAGRAARHGHGFCLVLCDADDFKRYNDRFGHQRGDDLLRHVGATISSHCRAGDTAYRYGGEEFLVVLPEQSVETGMAFAERVRRAVAASPPPGAGGNPLPVVTLSMGVAASSAADGLKHVDQVLREADLALYDAKRRGKNRVVGHLPTS